MFMTDVAKAQAVLWLQMAGMLNNKTLSILKSPGHTFNISNFFFMSVAFMKKDEPF